jgi:23S rRNA pseudouridine1911/1915/1917 synthase
MDIIDEEDLRINEEETLYERYRIEVDAGQGKLRIDKFLNDRLPAVSRNKIQEGIREGYVLVNAKKVKPNYLINPRDLITISMPEPPRETDVLPEDLPIRIVYEDEDLIVVNKEAGMVVHPAHGNWTGTLANALIYHYHNLPDLNEHWGRPGLVHRIDKDTSGLLVVAKNEAAFVHLARQFFDHSIERTYCALIWGEPAHDTGTINAPLGRNPKNRLQVVVYEDDNPHGKHAITHYKVLKRLRYVSLIECKLETGRTHQIRAHLKHVGHTLFGDELYGGDKILRGNVFSKYKAFVENCLQMMPRQALHAKSLGFVHPRTKEKLFFDSELPTDFTEVLAKWEHYVQFN